MAEIIKNITKKTAALAAVFAVILLNFSSIVQCGKMFLDDDCCHTQNLVKPCCVKHLKITSDPRITGNCGCSMKESHQNPDMYLDISSNQHRQNIQNLNYSDVLNEMESVSVKSSSNQYYSPPGLYSADIYLSNMNLRI